MKQKTITLKNKLSFAAGDFFGGGSFNIVNFLYPGFLALTVGLPPFWISFVMFVARAWDSISDPLMGRISDATSNKRFGKRRIFLVAASPLVILAMFLMFFPYSFESLALRVISVLLSYIFFCTIQTMIMIPYYSLSSELSYDYKNRASANSMRLAFSIFSSILCVAVPGMIVNIVGGDNGYIAMSLLFGTLFGISVLVTGLFTREEIVSPPVKRKFRFDEFTRFLKVKPFVQYIGMFITVQMTMAIMSAMFFFFIDFYVCREVTATGETSMLGLVAAALMFSTQIVALPFYLWVINKKNKAFAYRLGSYIWIVCAIIFFMIKPGTPGFLVIAISVAIGFGISGPGLICHAMFGDVVDASEIVMGGRNEGSMSGFVNFANKVAQAVGLSIVMAILGFFNFQERQPSGAPILSQPESAQNAIRAIMCFAPIIILIVGIFISYRYKIDMEKQKQIKDSINNNEIQKINELKTEFTL